MAEFEDFVLDLGDDAAATLCLSCGARFARAVPLCNSCQATSFAPRDRLLALLTLSAPAADPRRLAKARLGLFLETEDPEWSASISEFLRERGIPFLIQDGNGKIGEKAAAEGPARFLVPEDRAHAARLELGAVTQRGPVPPPDPAWLCDAADGMELIAIEAALTEAGIPAFRRETLRDHGIRPPEGGHLPLFVAPSNLEPAHRVLDSLEDNPLLLEEPEAPPPQEHPEAFSSAPGRRSFPWLPLVAALLILLFLVWHFTAH